TVSAPTPPAAAATAAATATAATASAAATATAAATRATGSAAAATAAAVAPAAPAAVTPAATAPAVVVVAAARLRGLLERGQVLAGVALRHDLALVDPALDADAAERRAGLVEAVVDVGAQRVQRHAAVGVLLGARHLGAAQAAG